jgi:hypothetical protein
VQGSSSEHEFFLGAKKLQWAEDIDGEILVNENEMDHEPEIGRTYRAKVTQVAGDKLVATLTGES